MDNQALEQRLTRIEEVLAKLDERLAAFDNRTVRAWEMHAVRTLKVELRVEQIEARIKELGEVERVAYEAYAKSSPEARAGIEEMNDAVETARGRIFFSNLPSIKDRDRQLKS